MRRPLSVLTAAFAALTACGGAAAPSDAELVALVKSIAPRTEACVERRNGKLISCPANNGVGQFTVYVDLDDKAAINIDLALSMRASLNSMTMFWAGVRDGVAKLGLEDDDYFGCTTGNTGSASFDLADYEVDCRSYNTMSTLNYDLRFKRK